MYKIKKNKFSQQVKQKMTFREDIQGLRALAVLSVVIYHISPHHLPGGFIGVDIFFVISGYLIMGQIYNKIQQNAFSISDFYVKRFKRLFPAFFATVSVSSFFAFLYFLPGEFSKYAWSLISSCLYVSNFYFYTKSGYFDSELQGSPLLHTWSLSVEEQFYAFMPVIMILAYGVCRRFSIAILSTIGALSFIGCVYLTHSDVSLAFFASFTRFWQFILGGAIAIYGLHLKNHRTLCELLTTIGVITLLASCFFLTHDEFPGIKAVIPTLATVAVLTFSRKGLFIYRLLSIKPAEFIGNISYSLYLWHWPVIIFYQLHFETELKALDKVIVLVCSILLGVLSYYFVEQRFRKSKNSKGVAQKAYIQVAFSSAILCAVVYGLTYVLPMRFNEQQLGYEEFMDNHDASYFRPGVCFLTSKYSDISYFKKDTCLIAQEEKENILLVGDSHAAHWYAGLEANKKPNQTISQITASGCKPTISYQGEKRCAQLMRIAFEEIIPAGKYEKIIISARWKIDDLSWLLKTLDGLATTNTEVVILGPIIEYTQPLPRILAHINFEEKLVRTRKYEFIARIDSAFENELRGRNAKYISILKSICTNASQCKTLAKNVPIQFDYGHLTFEGSLYLLKI
ncbi:acyltransferase [Alteromonas sp. MmMcT2-2]|uniref:acyltransferase family protein n=1 Tax=Alteromonas sp. MmMcT2-2 TaxID=2917732 RepID=UPI001EF1F7E8|nr:acyltransferase [Alteromonas sp. MmMcT2-2]